MTTINENTILLIKGKKVDVPTFMVTYGVSSTARALELMATMVKKNKATIYTNATAEDEVVNALDKEIELTNAVLAVEEEERAYAQSKREAKKEGVDLTSIRLSFKTSAEAVNAELWINEKLGIEDTEVRIIKGKVCLDIKDITPQEYTKIANRYQMDKAIGATVDFTSKALNNTTDAINYGLTNVLAPTAKIAGEAGMNIGKGLVHTSVKVGASLVNAGAKAVEDTAIALSTDTELLKAKKQLVDAKDSALGFFKRKLGSAKRHSGIEEI